MALRTWKRSLAALALVVLASRADAGLLPVSATVTPDGGNQRYTYGIVLTSDSTLKTGDFFTVYDFQGMVPGSNVQPAGFTLTTSNAGGTPVGTNPTDDPTKPNLTWTYTGAGISGQVGLGNFAVDSTNEPSASAASFTAQTHRTADGKVDSNITETTIPGGPIATPASIPEPATLALMGIGLPLVGLFRCLRRRKA